MEDIQNRLSETGAACLSAFEAWDKSKSDEKAKEALNEAVHELRKVAARIEIEMAVSERDPKKNKRIPIPEHRDAVKGGKAQQGASNDDAGGASEEVTKSVKPLRRRTTKAAD